MFSQSPGVSPWSVVTPQLLCPLFSPVWFVPIPQTVKYSIGDTNFYISLWS